MYRIGVNSASEPKGLLFHRFNAGLKTCSTPLLSAPLMKTGLACRRGSFLVPVSLLLVSVSQGQDHAFSPGGSRDLQADGQSCFGETAGNCDGRQSKHVA